VVILNAHLVRIFIQQQISMMKEMTLIILMTGVSECFSQSPRVRNSHSMVFYTSSKSIILFGGADEAKVYGDTWSFSGGKIYLLK